MAGIPHHVINRASRRSVIFGVDDDYRTFMKWLTGTQTQQWHARSRTTGTGPLYQGRFKAIPGAVGPPLLDTRSIRAAQSCPRTAGAPDRRMALAFGLS
jgi:hypothetical protein